MECIGQIISPISRDLESGGLTVTLSLNEVSVQELQTAKGIDKLSIIIKQYRNKRSLDANAYYWQLITKLAESMSVSKPMMHNMILRKYGQYELIDNCTVRMPIPDTEEAEKAALEAQTYHIKPTSQVKNGIDGVIYRTYVMLKGSSDYDTREMHRLIDGLISDCVEVGIETLPPAEVERMMAAYEHNKKYRHGTR